MKTALALLSLSSTSTFYIFLPLLLFCPFSTHCVCGVDLPLACETIDLRVHKYESKVCVSFSIFSFIQLTHSSIFLFFLSVFFSSLTLFFPFHLFFLFALHAAERESLLSWFILTTIKYTDTELAALLQLSEWPNYICSDLMVPVVCKSLALIDSLSHQLPEWEEREREQSPYFGWLFDAE